MVPIVGTGREDDPYRVDHDGSYDQAVIPSDPNTGAPLHDGGRGRRGPGPAKAGATLIPDRSVTLTTEQRDALVQTARAKGVDWQGPVGDGEQRGQFHRAIAAHLWPEYRMPDTI